MYITTFTFGVQILFIICCPLLGRMNMRTHFQSSVKRASAIASEFVKMVYGLSRSARACKTKETLMERLMEEANKDVVGTTGYRWIAQVTTALKSLSPPAQAWTPGVIIRL